MEYEITAKQEYQELERINGFSRDNRAEQEAVLTTRMAAKRKRYNIRTVYEIGGLCALGAAVAACGSANLMAPVIAVPVVLASVCLSFLRFGVWIGRH